MGNCLCISYAYLWYFEKNLHRNSVWSIIAQVWSVTTASVTTTGLPFCTLGKSWFWLLMWPYRITVLCSWTLGPLRRPGAVGILSKVRPLRTSLHELPLSHSIMCRHMSVAKLRASEQELHLTCLLNPPKCQTLLCTHQVGSILWIINME